MSIGIHIQADSGRSEQELYDIAIASGGRTHTVLNGPGVAARLLAAGKRVIYRYWAKERTKRGHNSDGDNRASALYDPVEYVDKAYAVAPRGSIIALGNEPNCANADEMRQLNDWTVAALHRCNELGAKAGIFSLPTGNPPDDALWQHTRPALQLAKDGGHLLLIHSYWGVDGDTDPLSGKNAPWHINKHTRIPAGLPLPEIVISEFGYCHQMNPHRGYSGILSEDAYADGLTRVQAEYAKRGIDSCLFVLTNKGSDKWDTFNPGERLITRIAAYNATEKPPVTQPTPPPEPTPIVTPTDKGAGIAGTLYTGDYVNLRPAPSTSAEPRIEIPNGAGVVWYPATERSNGGWSWVYVETGDRSGWMARVWPSWSTQFAPITPDVPLKPSVSLDIPWVSQLGSDAPDANDCGPAAATSAIRAAGIRLNRDDLKTVTPNAFNDHLGNKQTGADVNDMVTALGRYGVTARALRATTANIKRELSAGRYPIVVIERGAIPPLLEYNEFSMAHWLGVRAYDASGFTLVDPLVTNGRDLRVTEAELATALSGSTWNGVRQSGYIGITVELPPPVVVVPTPADPPPPVETVDTALMALNAAMLEWGRRDKIARAAFEDSTAARMRFEELLNDYLTLNSMENAA